MGFLFAHRNKEKLWWQSLGYTLLWGKKKKIPGSPAIPVVLKCMVFAIFKGGEETAFSDCFFLWDGRKPGCLLGWGGLGTSRDVTILHGGGSLGGEIVFSTPFLSFRRRRVLRYGLKPPR